MLFDVLTEEEKALFAGICRISEYAPEATVVKEGDSGRTILIVRRGRAEARKPLGGKKYKLLKELKPGDFFGETTFLCGCPRSADVVAVEKTEILECEMQEFDAFCREYPEAGIKIYKVMAQEVAGRLRQNNEDLKKAVNWASKA